MAEIPTKTDEALLQEIRRGDLSAFEALYARYQDWVVALAYRFAGDREDALDVLQETFAYFFRKLPGFELRCQLKTFLYPAVKHLALSRKEARLRQAPLPRGADPAVPDRAPGEVDALLGGLPEGQKEVVLMRFVDGLDLKEIADSLEIPLGTVKSRLHAAIETLRRTLPNR